MAIYCVSDVHGRFRAFQKLLDNIALGDSDELYVLGDIIDYGPDSAEMLVWAVNKAPANIHFLCGNHEDMALEVVRHNPSWLQQSKRKTLWTHNGGRATASRLKKITHGSWRANDLLHWLEKLPVYACVSAGGRDFMLVHAGFDPNRFGTDEDPRPQSRDGYMNIRSESNFLHLSQPVTPPEIYNVGHGFGWQGRDEMLWLRKEWYLNADRAPMHVVHGHTTFEWSDIDRVQLAAVDNSFSGKPGSICHYFGNRHNIDCGAGTGEAPYRLGAMRLNDFAEFYVRV